MRKSFLSLIGSLLIFTVFAKQHADSRKEMQVEGSIVSISHKSPLKDELIIFKSTKTLNKYEVFSDESGKFSVLLPVGDKYRIYVLGAQDSTAASVIDIPENLNSKNPFFVSLEFEPVKVFILRDVEFDYAKADINPESYKALDDLVKYLERKIKLKIEIGLHTDNIGRESKNHELSVARAKAVVEYLISKGIEKKRLSSNGYGSHQPVADNTTEEGRGQNRRTEVKILNL